MTGHSKRNLSINYTHEVERSEFYEWIICSNLSLFFLGALSLSFYS